MEVQVTMELWWTLNMISLSCAVYIGTVFMKLICKAFHYMNLLYKEDKQ